MAKISTWGGVPVRPIRQSNQYARVAIAPRGELHAPAFPPGRIALKPFLGKPNPYNSIDALRFYGIVGATSKPQMPQN